MREVYLRVVDVVGWVEALAEEVEAVQLVEDVQAGDIVSGMLNEAGCCVGKE